MIHRNRLKYLLLLSIIGMISCQEKAPEKRELSTSPEDVGERIAENILGRGFGWRYQKVCSYYGALVYAGESGKTSITEGIEKGFRPFYEGKKKARMGHVDFNVFGIWPFELYRQTGNKDYLDIARGFADDEFRNPRPDGLTELSRFWVDDMYMVGSLQVQAYKALKDPVYLDRAALHILNYCDSLQRPNGLFHHRPDVPHYWGRGNGWAAASMGELLSVLPEDHTYYDQLVSSYRKMMKGLIEHQGSDGMWHQLLDDHESFPESSCTGMFLFSMITGIEQGILKEEAYLNAVEKGWDTLSSDFVNAKGEVIGTCMWTNAKKREGYYLRRPRFKGDYHGQAAVLWASAAMMRLMD